MTLEFFEGDRKNESIPGWVLTFLHFGIDWARNVDPERRRVAVISMPCESAGAGLISLGAMITRLSIEANELTVHAKRVKALEKNHTVSGLMYWDGRKYDGPYSSVGKVDSDGIRLVYKGRKKVQEGVVRFVRPGDEMKVRFPGEPPVYQKEEVPGKDIYESLALDNVEIREDNLKSTDKWLCFAGRKMGKADAERVMKNVSFKTGNQKLDLKRLLLFPDSKKSIYRTCYYNTRGRNDASELPMERIGLVVADGLGSLMEVLRQREFAKKDVIGVFHRIRKRDDLEALKNKMSELDIFYERRFPDSALQNGVGAVVFESRGN